MTSLPTHSDTTRAIVPPRIQAILDAESRDIGRPCKLLDWAVLAYDVVAVVYEPSAYEGEALKGNREIRTATYVGDKPKYSTIVTTTWREASCRP